MSDHYELLGVLETAPIGQIRSAYRKLALKLHPDRNPGDEAGAKQFSGISAAYQVLADPRTREVYDRERRRTAPRPARRPRDRKANWGQVHPEVVPIQVVNAFRRGPIQVTGGFPMNGATVVVVNGMSMPGVKIFKAGSTTTTSF
jgi:curved DNA-binding protein CbpA